MQANAVSNNPKIDLTNCDKEAIHLIGSVQPFGYLIAIDSSWRIVGVSQNVGEQLGMVEQALLGQKIDDCVSINARKIITESLQWLKDADDVERRFAVPLFNEEALFDIAIYRSSDEVLIVEAEAHHPVEDAQPLLELRTALKRIMSAKDTQDIFDRAASTLQKLTDFDRVMVYQFQDDLSGKVIAEARKDGIDSFNGMCFPASDIPKQARALYVRNTSRIISDVNAKDIPISTQSDMKPSDFDLSMSISRSVSPMHIEYLSNMGIQASMSISIVIDGTLWGLFACHNHSPLHVPYAKRSIAELFGEMFAIEYNARDGKTSSERETLSDEIHSELLSNIKEESLVFNHLKPLLGKIQRMIPCDAVVLTTKEGTVTNGIDIGEKEVHEILKSFDLNSNKEILFSNAHNDTLSELSPALIDMAGLLIIPLSVQNPDVLLLFRKEEVKTVSWAGDPNKPVTTGPNGDRLTPRKSFDLWKEIRRGLSKPWSREDKTMATKLRHVLLDIILQNIDEREKIRSQAKGRQDILVQELNHRVRNILGLIRGVTNRTADTAQTIDEFKSVLNGRIQALASAHDQLTEKDWNAASLPQLIKKEIEAFATEKDNISLPTNDIRLTAPAFSCLTLVIHELVTNAVKHGALKDDNGSLDINWREFNDHLILEWTETTQHKVEAPQTRGFGSTIIERSVPFELNGLVDIDYQEDGLKARFSIPMEYVVQSSENHLINKAQSSIGQSLDAAKSILILEDNVLIAMDAYDIFKNRGTPKVLVKSNNNDAIRAINSENIDFAVLDIHLGHDTSFITADRLKEAGIPFVFATGYDTSLDMPEAHKNVPIINKPYNAKQFDDLQ